jgi:TRAP-type uncharacterized transport system substrate-binding protein
VPGVAVGLGIALALSLTEPLPPRRVTMATGPAGGAYAAVGPRYREIFARHGIRLELLATRGSVDNVERLRDPRSGVSIALVQGGATSAARAPELVSLGTLFYEPLWLFSRIPPASEPGKLLEGRVRLSFGVPGSGTYALSRELAAAVGLDLGRAEVRDLEPVDAAAALTRGELDLVGISGAWDTPTVRRLLLDPSVWLQGVVRADAQVALRSYLSKVVLPRGVADLASDRPPADVTLLATKASLVVREDLHPALQYLLLEAASEIHAARDVFSKAGEFPTPEPIDLPLSSYARQYYRSGQPLLQRYLPFWMAALTSRLLVLLIPVVGVLYPLFRLLPALYGWGMRRRIFRLYGELKFLEAELASGAPGGVPSALAERLDRLEQRADRLHIPVAFADMLYTLKLHIGLVRQRVRAARMGDEGPNDPAPPPAPPSRP